MATHIIDPTAPQPELKLVKRTINKEGYIEADFRNAADESKILFEIIDGCFFFNSFAKDKGRKGSKTACSHKPSPEWLDFFVKFGENVTAAVKGHKLEIFGNKYFSDTTIDKAMKPVVPEAKRDPTTGKEFKRSMNLKEATERNGTCAIQLVNTRNERLSLDDYIKKEAYGNALILVGPFWVMPGTSSCGIQLILVKLMITDEIQEYNFKSLPPPPNKSPAAAPLSQPNKKRKTQNQDPNQDGSQPFGGYEEGMGGAGGASGVSGYEDQSQQNES